MSAGDRLSPEREQETREEAEPYRDDVRDVLTAFGWREDSEGFLRKDGALWTEINDYLESGLDGPDGKYGIEFTSEVPATVVTATCLAAVGVDVPALLAEVDRLSARVTELEAPVVAAGEGLPDAIADYIGEHCPAEFPGGADKAAELIMRKVVTPLLARVAELEASLASELPVLEVACATVAEQAQRLAAREREHNADRAELERLRAELDSASTALAREQRLSGLDCGHGPQDLCEDCHACPCAICTVCKVCACVCECAERAGEPTGSPAAYIAAQLDGMDNVLDVTVHDPTTVTVEVRPRDLDGWQRWLGRFQVPVASITSRGSVTTAKGTAPGGVTVCIVGHGITKLQAAAIPHITRRGGAS